MFYVLGPLDSEELKKSESVVGGETSNADASQAQISAA